MGAGPQWCHFHTTMLESINYGWIALKTQVIQSHRLYELNLNPELIGSGLLISGWALSLNLKEWEQQLTQRLTDIQSSVTPWVWVAASHSAASLRHAAAASRRPARRWWSALHLLLLHQPPVVGQDFTLGQIERHLQGHQDGKLKGDQLLPADAETLLQLLQRGHSPHRQKEEVEKHLLYSQI